MAPNPPSYDKQFVRDWLEQAKVNGKPWDKTAPAPRLPQEGDRENTGCQVPRGAGAPHGLISPQS